MFPLPKGKPEFSKLEEAILAKWKAEKTFEKSVESRPAENPYRFYDGPPFITGTPHYGSLLSSIIKDVVPRYQTMLGKRVERVWGWDCHGMPIEQKVQKKLGLESNKEIEESEGGIQHFIDECYNYTRETSADWSWYIDHIGRWVDMDNAYRTMDQDYMESVMWVFKQIWEKGYVYEGKRVSWYSWKLSTPISNFEIAMDDSYQDVQDPAITVKFPLMQKKEYIDEIQGGKFEYTEDGYLRYVLAVIKNAEGEILMLQNKKHGNRWQCPGGKIDAGETAENALKRELQEELGVEIEIISHLGNRKIMTENTLWQGEYFEVKLNGDPALLEPEKHTQMQWMKIVEDSELVHGYYLQYSEHVVTEQLGQMYDAIALRSIQKGLPELKQISILAWTTTPWTIPMHMALAVHRDIMYVLVQSGDEGYFVAKNRLETVFKGKEYTIITEYSGDFLVDKRYHSPFDFYQNITEGLEKSFRVYHADFVTDTDGTGIAHEAPEFGDVDFQLAKEHGIHITSAIDAAGKYTAEVPDYQGQLYLDCNDQITERLKTEGTLFKKEGITHRVPYCPRSNTPLMQRAQKSWFIDIQRIKGELIAQNENINWFPEHFKHGRFLKSLESAPDWCISRSRFWGTPMPIWQNEDGSERVVIGSREELYQANKPLGQITKVICVRHAESESNVVGFYDDIGESPLSEKGKQQAQELAEKLASEGIEVILSSPFTRTLQTAVPIAEKLGITIQTLDALREIDHGKFGNATNDDASRASRNAFRDDKNVKFGETGESLNDIRARMREVSELIKNTYTGKTILIVTHGFSMQGLFEEFGKEKMPEKYKNAMYGITYLGPDGKEMNLHRPKIDTIVLPSQKAESLISSDQRSGEQKTENITKLVILRHAQSEANVAKCYDDTGSSPLSIAGKKQAQDLVERLKKEGIDIILSSPFVRTIQTITPFAESSGLPIETMIEFKETAHGKFANTAQSDDQKNDRIKIWEDHDYKFGETGESVNDLKARAQKVIEYITQKYPGKTVAIVSHGFPVRTLEAQLGATSRSGKIKNADPRVIFLDNETQKAIPVLERIPEVLDVWMDSASMPYAQVHYPFENVEKMEASFPADFIAEYTGQIRAWFYVMHAIGVMIKGSPAFKNVAVTGVINGTDGRKMSKSYGNYPDPKITIEQYGADALRFYLMGGPIMRGEDMSFSETGISESLKKVLIPLWNSYTFFATYANIDGWQPDGTEIWFTRHAESQKNVESRMSGGEDDSPLSDKGREQVKVLLEQVKNMKPFDAIFSSPRKRTVDTISGLGEYTLDERFLEQDSGEYAGMLLSDIGKKLGTQDMCKIRDAYRWNTVEPWDVFYKKIAKTLDQVIVENAGKKILIAAHAGVFRACTQYFYNLQNEDVFYGSGIQNACLYRFPKTPKTHELDTWILSQLHNLVADTRKHMDNYDTQKACDGFVTFLDGLNNWYIRRNRRRFWRKEVDADKCSAYETLHEVLTTVCQLLAPICPFMTEYLYQNLTHSHSDSNGKDFETKLSEEICDNSKSHSTLGLVPDTGFSSVHLTYFPAAHPLILNLVVNQKMHDLQNLTNLGLAIRGREKLRVRQPLRSASITLNLDESARATLAEELNVKEIHTISDIAEYVTITYSPDAKQIGATERKQWMKTIIADAKAGKGSLLDDGSLQIDCPEAPEGKILLTAGEFETIYTPKEGSTIAFSGNAGYVIGLDTTLDEALTFEGYARDLIRAIQDTRKDMGFQVMDRLQLALASENIILAGILGAHKELIESETLCTLADSVSSEEKVVDLDEGLEVCITLSAG